MTASRTIRIVLLLLVLGGTVGCDQTTKRAARTYLKPFDSLTLMGGVGELRLVQNPGAFLSLGAALPPVGRTVIFTCGTGAGLLFLSVYLVGRAGLSRISFTGVALALAGGVSNLIDRVTSGGLVTDFIALRLGPFQTGVFNLADVAVLLGVGVLVFARWKPECTAVKNSTDDV